MVRKEVEKRYEHLNYFTVYMIQKAFWDITMTEDVKKTNLQEELAKIKN